MQDATKNNNKPNDSHIVPPATPVFSMTNEEADIDAFRDYLAVVAPESLWDVRAHLDADRYPRRYEAVHREMRRRGLFFVTPYTDRELKIRALSAWGFGLAAFVAGLRAVEIADARLRAVGTIKVDLAPGEETPFFLSLATGGAKAARVAFPLALPIAVLVGVATVGAAVYAVAQLRSGRIRRDVAAIAAVASAVATVFLWWAWRA